jgi:hypothetical protein
MNTQDTAKLAQELLYKWMHNRNKATCYQGIDQKCEYLNIATSMNLEAEKPVSFIFYPLFYSGVIDITDDNKYSVTPSCLIKHPKQKTSIIVNPTQIDECTPTDFVGIYKTEKQDSTIHQYQFSAEAILSNYPTLKKVVEGFERKSDYDFNSNKVQGIIDKGGTGFTRYFVEGYKCFIIPSVPSNPEALPIARSYERVIKNKTNGIYNTQRRELKLNKWGLPILIFRVLLIECLLLDAKPIIAHEYYVFPKISPSIIRKINKIYCHSITIENE